MKRLLFRLCLTGTLLGFSPVALFTARADWFDQGPVFSMMEENDTVMQTDRYYSQGLKMTYLHTDDHVPGWINSFSGMIPALGFSVKAVKIGTEVGQDVYTPANISTNGLQVRDRPYAGWLYTGFIVQRKGLTDGGQPVLENFQLDIGIIGPDSLADQSQSWAHGGSHSVLVNWRNQLKDEPGIALKYERTWVFSPGATDQHRYFDLVPRAGMSLGNVETSLRAGGMMRVGINLPDDFGPQTIHSLTTVEGGKSASQHEGRYGLYFFTGAEGRVIAYNAFLDGNLWRDSHHVTKEPLVGEFNGGLVAVLPIAELQVSGVYRTDEFTLQDGRGAYCTLVLKFKL